MKENEKLMLRHKSCNLARKMN